MQQLKYITTAVLIGVFGVILTGCGSNGSTGGAESTAGEDTWQRLFNGEDTTGWYNPYDWGEVRVVNGEIRLEADEKFFLVTEKIYRDFIFEAEVRVPDREANSGIMFRANVDTNRVWGYQAEVDPSERAWSGGLYDEDRRGWLHPPAGDKPAGEAFREQKGEAFNPDAWNLYRIEAREDSLKIWVNGTLTTAYRDTMDRQGHIGIQHHGEEGKVYRFRNLRVREL